MSNHNNPDKFAFKAQVGPDESYDPAAEKFDQELELMLRKGMRSHPGSHTDLIQLAAQLRQTAPSPIRPDPAFRVRLAEDLRRRAARTSATEFIPRKNPLFGLGWRLGGSVALATLVLVSAVVTLNLNNLTKSSSNTTPINMAINFTTEATTTGLTFTQLAAITPLATTNPTIASSLISFGQLPTNSYPPAANAKPSVVGARLVTIKPNSAIATTPVLSNFNSTSSPSSPNSVAQSADNPILTYNLKTDLLQMSATGQVFRQIQPQITETRLRSLATRFDLDATKAKYNYESADINYYTLTDTDKALSIGSNGHLTYTAPKPTYPQSAALSDAEADNIATSYLNKLGLPLNGSGWGNFQKTVFPVASGDNSGLRYISYSPVNFQPDSKTAYPVSESITIELTINANRQVTFFDSNLPVLLDEQGKLDFAPMEAANYPLINSDQLKAAIAKGQINLTYNTALKLQQTTNSNIHSLSVTLTKMETAYAPTYSNDGRLHLVPIVMVHGTMDVNASSFDGYIFQVQNQYLQNNP